MPSKAFVDTSVFTDAALKQTAPGDRARSALHAIDFTQLPVYALKEFKAGPLRNYVWLYNKALVAAAFTDVMDAIGAVWRQRYKQSTALGALRDFESSIVYALPADWARQYPGSAVSQIRIDELRTWLKTKILLAWRRWAKLTNQVVEQLACYPVVELTIDKYGRIDDRPVVCTADCVLRDRFAVTNSDREKLIAACNNAPVKPETNNRRAALKLMGKKKFFPEKSCRNLGDAVVAFQCPHNAAILTTNVADMAPLADALGKKVCTPEQVIDGTAQFP